MRPIASALAVSILGMLLTVPASAQDVPFVGVVTQNDTKVRAGAGRAYYVVGELDQGAVVQVDEIIFGWNKIVPPEGFYSYIAEGFVEVKGDGRTGTITQDRSEVKAGSVKGPGDSYRGQVVLNRGDTVEIIEREGTGYYRIAPPKGAYVYLPPGSVNRATPEQLASAQQEQATAAIEAAIEPQPEPDAPAQAQAQAPAPTPPAAPDPAAETATETDAVVSTAPEGSPEPQTPAETGAPTTLQAEETVTAEAPADPAAPAADTEADVPTTTLAGDAETDSAADAAAEQAAAEAAMMSKASNYRSAAVSDKLKALEERMIPQFFRPLEQQPIHEMIQAYEAIQREPLPAVDRQIVAMRLAALRRNRDIAETLAMIQTATSSPTEVSVPQAEPGAPLRYDAVGTLLASSVYNGTSLPRMFRIVDPATGRTIVWVEPGGPVDAKRYLGKVVGVVGEQTYDPALKFNVLDVQRIDVLEAQTAATQ